MSHALQLLAGPRALEHLRERGLDAGDINIVAGASGGPKWLVLAGLDRVIFGNFLSQVNNPLHLIGSSIGSWRMACLAQAEPLAALHRLEQAYIEQSYSAKPQPAEVTEMAASMLDHVLGETGEQEILANPNVHLHVITARCRGFAGSEQRHLQTTGLALAALANIASRSTLCWQMQRVIFGMTESEHPFDRLADMPTTHLPLTRENLRPALMASGSIPLVLEGVRIPGAPPGIYRDGGMTDYHLDLDYGDRAGLVLYPHFYSHVVPGWFDKPLRWRRARARNFNRALLLAPSDEFVAKLPGGRIPDRKDFHRYDNTERMRVWRAVAKAGEQLGEEFSELLATGKWQQRVRPLPWKEQA